MEFDIGFSGSSFRVIKKKKKKRRKRNIKNVPY